MILSGCGISTSLHLSFGRGTSTPPALAFTLWPSFNLNLQLDRNTRGLRTNVVLFTTLLAAGTWMHTWMSAVSLPFDSLQSQRQEWKETFNNTNNTNKTQGDLIRSFEIDARIANRQVHLAIIHSRPGTARAAYKPIQLRKLRSATTHGVASAEATR